MPTISSSLDMPQCRAETADFSSNFVLERMMQSLPKTVAMSFSSQQLLALQEALKPPPKQHLIDFRVSLPFLLRRYYVVVLFGKESRSQERLRSEGQIQFGPIMGTYGVLVALIASLMLISAAVCYYSVSALL